MRVIIAMPKALFKLFVLPCVMFVAALAWVSYSIASVADGRRVKSYDLATLGDIESLSVSPDGQWAAFQVRRARPETNGYDTGWFVTPTVGGPARKIGDAGEVMFLSIQRRLHSIALPQKPAWSPDSLWLTYLRRENGRTQIWQSRRTGTLSRQLTYGAMDVRALVYSSDGRRILFETEPSDSEIDADLSSDAQQGFLFDQRFNPVYSLRPLHPRDTTLEGFSAYTPSQVAARQIRTYEFANGRERRATPSEEIEFAALMVPLQSDDKRVLSGWPRYSAASSAGSMVRAEEREPTSKGRPLRTIIVQPVGSPEATVCRAAECTSRAIRGLWWRNEREIIFARGEDPKNQDTALYAWRIGSDVVRQIFRTPYWLTQTDSRCAISMERLICFYEEPDRPRRLVSLDLDSGELKTLYDPNPVFAGFDLGSRPARLEIARPSGVPLFDYLVLPPDYRSGKRLPLVVTTYVCSGFIRGGTGDEYPVYALAAEGFAVLCHNIWGTDYEGVLRENGEGLSGEARDLVDGLAAAVDHLDALGLVDRQRVGITGQSSGASTVNYSLHFRPTLAAAAITSGHMGFERTQYFLEPPAVRAYMRSMGLGLPAKSADAWRKLAPMSDHVDRIRAPLLINAPDHEVLTNFEPVVALQEGGRAVEMYVFPDEYHAKWQPAHRLAIYNRNIDWMNFWLQGREDSAPAKAEQYKRWRAMRVKQCELFGKEPDAPWYCRP